MNTPLFHATAAVLKLHQPMLARIRTVCKDQARIDWEFDRLRPPAISVSRSTALFAGDDPQFCATYLASETKTAGNPVNIYRVEMVAPSKHPMYLVSYARFVLDDKETLTKIIREYWAPTHPWKCWEYPTESMTPVAIEPTPDGKTKCGVTARYSGDASLAMKLWPKP
jgi:hypothetical protein